MMTLKSIKQALLLMLALGVGSAWAAGGAAVEGWDMQPMNPDLENKPSLQNGFKLYANYCLGCHGLQFQRYERTADDLGIPHELALKHLVFTDQKIGEQIKSAMDPTEAKQWFGAPPPDLTMVTRVRGHEWVFNYLKAFYIDESRPFGVNNQVFANVGMPHVLMGLQGVQRKGCVQKPKLAANGGEMRDPLVAGRVITEEKCDEIYLEEGTGSMTADEYDSAIYDLVNFMYYVGEPSRLQRERMGVYVLLFLVILGAFTYLLNREFWKDVH